MVVRPFTLTSIEIRTFGLYAPTAATEVGLALKEKGDLEDAILSFRKAIKFMPENPKLYYNLGITLYKQGDYIAAINSYKESLGQKIGRDIAGKINFLV